MKLVFFASDKKREHEIGEAFCAGAARHGVTASIVPSSASAECDVAVMFGVKSARTFYDQRAAGANVIMLDKGYIRQKVLGSRAWDYMRVAVNGHHPTRYLMDMKKPSDRTGGLYLEPWRERGGHIVIAGSSAKYHAFYDLPDPTTYAAGIVSALQWVTDRKIIYRPKPSWRDAVPIHGTQYSGTGDSIADVLHGAWAVITHGSNSCFEAMLAGVPSVVLGDGIAAPLSSTSLAEIENPRLASRDERQRWLNNVSYCQWTLDEFASGMAWKTIKRLL